MATRCNKDDCFDTVSKIEEAYRNHQIDLSLLLANQIKRREQQKITYDMAISAGDYCLGPNAYYYYRLADTMIEVIIKAMKDFGQEPNMDILSEVCVSKEEIREIWEKGMFD